MFDLPINEVIAEICETLQVHNRVVLQAPPGAGKTTAVPIALLNQSWLKNRQIILLEPRRLAARNAAARMAQMLNQKVGASIGYQIRQDSCFSNKTKILVVTEGILTRKLQADPELQNTALVIFDEFHERNLHADLSLALCLQSQQVLRDDLKILVMSATLNTHAIANLLRHSVTSKTPIIQSKGRSFAVDIHYLDKTIKSGNNSQLMASLLTTVKHVMQSQNGSCLVFLPGVKEINLLLSRVKQMLTLEKKDNIQLMPLHGSLSKQQQDQAIMPPATGMRKIVFTTNIAETSLTIEGINCVIDSGLERILQFNPASAMNRLHTQVISQDSAIQRCGRAGRLSAGTCYRLWTESQQQRLLKHALAEIKHSDLTPLVLELANWGVREVDELQWLDTPPDSAIAPAKILLQQLNALNALGNITEHGQNMLKLGCHPRLAHMMLKAQQLEQAYLACLLASLLTEKDLYLANTAKSFDIDDRLHILQDMLQNMADTAYKKNQHGINLSQCKKIIQTANDFQRRLKPFRDTKNSSRKNSSRKNNSEKNIDVEKSGVILAYAYPDRIAKQRHHNKPAYLLSNGKGASIPDFLQRALYEYLVVANLDSKQAEATIYLAAEITQAQLQHYLADNIQQTEIVAWNETQQRVEAKQVSSIGKIRLQEKIVSTINKEKIKQLLLQAIKKTNLQCLNWSPKASNLQQRVQFINNAFINNKTLKKQLHDEFSSAPLPSFTNEDLSHSIETWLLPYLKNETSIKQCQKLDMYALLWNQLNWQQQKLLEALAPEHIKVPSGSAININYSDALQPILAVRLQEVFGLYETPTLLRGHVKVMLHLLSPARRPMQVTQDLNSFWQTTYHQVKKELRGKYKRHYWPDDPFTAQATSKTKKQMNR